MKSHFAGENAPEWGAFEINRAMDKMAFQYGDSGGKPALGTDFDFDPACCTSCIYTASGMYPWWAVDLEDSYEVYRVDMMTRDSTGKNVLNYIVND